jgi:hypothetical protein
MRRTRLWREGCGSRVETKLADYRLRQSGGPTSGCLAPPPREKSVHTSERRIPSGASLVPETVDDEAVRSRMTGRLPSRLVNCRHGRAGHQRRWKLSGFRKFPRRSGRLAGGPAADQGSAQLRKGLTNSGKLRRPGNARVGWRHCAQAPDQKNAARTSAYATTDASCDSRDQVG